MFKIRKEVFIKFLERIVPVNTINDAVFDFTEEGISVISVCSLGSILCQNFLSKEVFSEYTAIGEVGLREIGTIFKMINTLDSEFILFEKTVQFLIFNDDNKNKEIKCLLPDINLIGRPPHIPTFEFSINFKIPSSINLLESIKKNSSSVNSQKIEFSFKDNKIKLNTRSNSDDFIVNEDFILEETLSVEEVVTSITRDKLIGVISKTGESSEVYFKTGQMLPLEVTINDLIKSTYLIATLTSR